MKKLITTTVLAMALSATAFAALAPTTFQTEGVRVGNGGNSYLEFNTGDGASNKRIEVLSPNKDVDIKSNAASVGDGTIVGNKRLKANTGAGTPPELRYNVGSSKWEFSHDGSVFEEFGSGGGGSSDPGDMRRTLNDIEIGTIVPRHFNQIADAYSTSLGTLTNTTVSSSRLALSPSQTAGSQERIKQVTKTLNAATGITNIAAQALAPKATTIAANTIVFNGDVCEFFPASKDVLFAKEFTSDSELVHQYLTNVDGTIARLVRSSCTYAMGPNESTLVVANPDALDLDFDLTSGSYEANLRVIPFDYLLSAKADTAASYDGMSLVDAQTTGTLRIPAEVLDAFTHRSTTLTGTVVRHAISCSPNGTYCFGVVLEAQASNAGTYHFYYSKDAGVTWAKYAYTHVLAAGSGVTEDALHGYLHTPQVVVADNGKAFSIFGSFTVPLSYHTKGVYSDLSIGSPVVTDSAAFAVDAENSVGTAGFICVNTTNNRQGWLEADKVDLSFIAVACVRQNDTLTVRFFSNGGATYQNSDLGAYPHHYGSRVGMTVTGTGSSHRVYIFNKNSTTNLQYKYYDQPSATPVANATAFTGDYYVYDCDATSTKAYCMVRENVNDDPRYFSWNVTGAPSFSSLRQLSPVLDLDEFIGLDVLENSAAQAYNYGRIPGPQVIINQADSNQVYFITDMVHPDGIVRPGVHEVRNDTLYEGVNTSHTGTSAGAHVEIRASAAYTLSGQTFTPTFTGRVRTATVELKKFGNVVLPSTITAHIYATTGGFPTGSPIATSTNTYDSRFITKGTGNLGQKVAFTFNSTPVTSGTVYGLVLSSDAAFDAVNYIGMMSVNSGAYAGGQAVRFDGSVWSVQPTNQDAFFEINGEWLYDLSRPSSESTHLTDTTFWGTDSAISLSSASTLTFTTKSSPTGISAVQRRLAGHTYKGSIVMGSGTTASTPSAGTPLGYGATVFDKGMILNTSLGTVGSAKKDAITGVVSATDRGEDRSGLNTPATYNVMTVVTDGSFSSGQAMEFNTSSSYIDYGIHVPGQKLHNVGSPFTIEAEVKLNTLPSVKGNISTIVSQLTNASGQKGWWFGIDTSNRLFFTGVADAGNITTTSTNTLTTGVTYLLRASGTGSLVRLYIDGTEVSYSAQPATTVTAGSTTSRLLIGGVEGTGIYALGGRIGYLEVSRGSASPVSPGYSAQPEMLSPVNAGRIASVNQGIGTGSATINTNYNQWGTAPIFGGNSAVTNTYEDSYLWTTPLSTPGNLLHYKIDLGRGSNRNTSGVYGTIERGL